MPNEKWLDTANNTQIIIYILAKPFFIFSWGISDNSHLKRLNNFKRVVRLYCHQFIYLFLNIESI